MLANKTECSSELRPVAGHSRAPHVTHSSLPALDTLLELQPEAPRAGHGCTLLIQDVHSHTERSHPMKTECELSSHPATSAAATARDRELSHTTPHYFCWHLPKKFFNSIQWGKREKYWRISFWDFDFMSCWQLFLAKSIHTLCDITWHSAILKVGRSLKKFIVGVFCLLWIFF